MARIGILTCSNATQDLGCSSVSCLADFRKRQGTFAEYPQDEKLTLVGIINCPGCPTLTGPDKLLQRIRALTDFKVDTIHFTYCMKSLCPFLKMYKKARESLQTPWRQLIVKFNYFLFMDLLGFLDSPLLIPAKMASKAGIFQGDHSSRIF